MHFNPKLCGITTPGLTLVNKSDSSWERNATIDDFVAIAQTADKLGYDHMTCSEHIGIPPDVEAVRGARYYDPLSIFGFLAAVTSTIRFTTYVLVLGYNHPLEIAKRYGTLDVVSGGRVVLGVGVGSLKTEFDVLGLGGAEFEQRGARGDDALRALRASLGQRLPEYHGPYYDFEGLIIDPCAIQQDMKLWVGGRSGLSLKRAVELGDGWAPFGLDLAKMTAMIAQANESPSWDAREKPLDVVLKHEGSFDPLGKSSQVTDEIGQLLVAGATHINASFFSKSRDHYIEQLESLASLTI